MKEAISGQGMDAPSRPPAVRHGGQPRSSWCATGARMNEALPDTRILAKPVDIRNITNTRNRASPSPLGTAADISIPIEMTAWPTRNSRRRSSI